MAIPANYRRAFGFMLVVIYAAMIGAITGRTQAPPAVAAHGLLSCVPMAATLMVTLRAFCIAANQTQKDALCTDSGQSAGCGICDIFQ